MNNGLEIHSRGYNLSLSDCLLSGVTLLSGAPYAKRHWEILQQVGCLHPQGHRFIAVLEAIPLIGGCVALIERVIVWIYNKFFNEPQSFEINNSKNHGIATLVPQISANDQTEIDFHVIKNESSLSDQSNSFVNPANVVNNRTDDILEYSLITPEENFKNSIMELRKQNLEQEEQTLALVKAYAEAFAPLPVSKYQRSYPALQLHDTCGFKINQSGDTLLTEEEKQLLRSGVRNPSPTRDVYRMQIQTLHRTSLSYLDDQIAVVIAVVVETQSVNEIAFLKGRLFNGSFVIQQNGIRGCVAACAAMLVSDRTQKYHTPKAMNLGDNDDIKRIVNEAGLKVKETAVNDLDELQKAIQSDGPATVSVSTAGNHEIVVDCVSEMGVHIRDPYHGWAVIIKKQAFLESWTKGHIIQAVI